MARILGLVPCSVNFEVNKTAPLDSRTVVDTVLELTETSTWSVDGKVWLYDGLVVAVKENNGLYVLNGFTADPLAYTNADNWHRIDASAAKIDVVDNLTSTDNTKALAASQGKVLSDKIENLKTSLSSVYNYKGSVANFAALPSNAEVGDTYNVVAVNGTVPAGTNYAWNGTEWDALGGSVDLSNYSTTTEVNTLISTAIVDAKDDLKVDELRTAVEANTAALLIVNGTEATEGSMANKLKIAKDYTDTQLTGYVAKVDGSSLIPNDKLALIDTLNTDLTALTTTVNNNTSAIELLNGDESTTGSILNTINNKITNALEWQTL